MCLTSFERDKAIGMLCDETNVRSVARAFNVNQTTISGVPLTRNYRCLRREWAQTHRRWTMAQWRTVLLVMGAVEDGQWLNGALLF